MNDPDLDRSLIEAARAELGPTDAERRRLRRSVVTALGAAAAGTAVSAAQATAAASAGVASWKVTALVVAGLSTVVAGGVAWTAAAPEPEEASTERAPSPELAEPAPPAPAMDALELPAVVQAAPLELPEPRPVAPETVELTPPAPSLAQPERRAAPKARTSPAPSVSAEPGDGTSAPERSPPEDSLVAETALLHSAHRALQTAAPERALALLSTHAARYPDGALREERAATRVLALCALGRTEEARAGAAAFLATHPSSMHAPRVRAACAAP